MLNSLLSRLQNVLGTDLFLRRAAAAAAVEALRVLF